MADFYKLNVYNDTRRLFKAVQNSTQKMPREYRYAFVLPIMVKIEKIMTSICNANATNVKSVVLEPAINEVVSIQITTRNLYELRLITKSGFSNISERSEAVKRQLVGWSKKYNGESVEEKPELM